MVSVTTLRHRGSFSRVDLEEVPDDGHRYELVDGAMLVTPAPSPQHQFVVGRLYVTLLKACPDELRVAFAPLDVTVGSNTVLQPDLLVASRDEFTERDLPVPPRLAVEVLSPSTRLIDTTLKRARFEAAGCPSYWIVDPDTPSLTAWELRGGRYVEIASCSGQEQYDAAVPYPVTIRPAALLD